MQPRRLKALNYEFHCINQQEDTFEAPGFIEHQRLVIGLSETILLLLNVSRVCCEHSYTPMIFFQAPGPYIINP